MQRWLASFPGLADKVHTNKENAFHNIATLISHNHPYIISSSDTLVGSKSIFIATYMGIGMCRNVMSCALLVCVLCQPVPLFSHTYICQIFKSFMGLHCGSVVHVGMIQTQDGGSNHCIMVVLAQGSIQLVVYKSI